MCIRDRSIASGNDDGVFAIGATTGAITVADTTNLDFETTASYDLVVQVSDGAGQTDTETITITITNSAPTVTDTAANLAETASASDAVVTVSTTGDTTSLTWSIASGNDDGVFAIGASTGAITVADTTNLDREATASYDLVVRATDGTTPDTETITITITDVAPTVTDTSGKPGRDGFRQRRRLDQVCRGVCLLYTSPSPRDLSTSRMPSSA